MLTFEEARDLFEADHWSVRTRARWQDASDDNFAAAYKFTVGVWNNHDEMVPNKETVMNILSKTFSDRKDFREMKPLGAFKKLDHSMTRKDIYNHWVARFKEKRVTERGEVTSIGKIFLDQVLKMQKKMLDTPMSRKTIVDCMAALLYNTSKGTAEELRLIYQLVRKYANNAKLCFRAAPDSNETDDIDAIFEYRESGKNIHRISIKVGGAISRSSVIKWKEKIDAKNERYFKKTGKRRPEVTLWIGVKEEGSNELIKFTRKDLE
jgi:hypothetical protein